MTLLSNQLEKRPFQYTFIQVIDADHFSINRMAAKVRKTLQQLDTASLNCSELLTTLYKQIEEITWRLIRHDLSEDLVMRPEFVQVLGQEGEQMSQRDREDHTIGRQVLLDVLARIKKARSQVADGEVTEEYLVTMREVGQQITDTFDTLGKHMAIESGQFLPYFETKISHEMSQRLGRRYWMSLFMTPTCQMHDGRKLFKDEADFISSPPEVLVEKYRQTMAIAERDGPLASHLAQVLEEELEVLQIERWTSMSKVLGIAELNGQSRSKDDSQITVACANSGQEASKTSSKL